MSIRRLVPIIAMASVVLMFALSPASADDMDYLRGKLVFLYVADPNASGINAETVNVSQVVNGGGSGEFYTAAHLQKFRDIIKAVFGSGMSGVNHQQMRHVLAETIRINNKPVGVYLVNDNSAPLAAGPNLARFGITRVRNHAWPCARCFTTNRDTQQWSGSLSMGIWHLLNESQYSTQAKVLETFCHEVMHTQDYSTGRAHSIGMHSYGPDQTHYFEEAMPDMAMTYKEGIANFVGYWYNTDEEQRVRRWFANNDYIIVEKNPPTPLFTRLQSAGVTVIDPSTVNFNATVEANYAIYRIRSLPADIIARNEQIIAIVLTAQTVHTSFDRVMASIRRVNPNTYMVSTSAWAQLVEDLCSDSLPSGTTIGSVPASDSGPKRYLLPIAIVDYFTGFRSQNETQFSEVFEGSLPQAWIQAYWQHRDTCRRAINPAALSPDDITNIARALGITQSVME